MMTVPSKTNAVLVVDPDAELTFAVTVQLFKSVSGRISQVFEPNSEVNRLQLPSSEPDNVSELPALPGEPDLSSLIIPE